MLTLYEIAAEYKADMEKLADLNLPAETVRDTIESISGDLQEKSKNIGFLVKHLETLADGMKQAEEQMATRRKALENRIQSVKNYTLDVMIKHGIQKIETPYFNLSVVKNPPAVEVFDEGQVPAHFIRQLPPPPPSIDKKSISETLRHGEDVPGCRLTQTVRLQIK